MVRRHIDHITYRSNSQPAEGSHDWMDLPPVFERNTTEQPSTVTATAPILLRRSTRIQYYQNTMVKMRTLQRKEKGV